MRIEGNRETLGLKGQVMTKLDDWLKICETDVGLERDAVPAEVQRHLAIALRMIRAVVKEVAGVSFDGPKPGPVEVMQAVLDLGEEKI